MSEHRVCPPQRHTHATACSGTLHVTSSFIVHSLVCGLLGPAGTGQARSGSAVFTLSSDRSSLTAQLLRLLREKFKNVIDMT